MLEWKYYVRPEDPPEDCVSWEAQGTPHSPRPLRLPYIEGTSITRKCGPPLTAGAQSWRMVPELGSLIAVGMMGLLPCN